MNQERSFLRPLAAPPPGNLETLSLLKLILNNPKKDLKVLEKLSGKDLGPRIVPLLEKGFVRQHEDSLPKDSVAFSITPTGLHHLANLLYTGRLKA